MNQFCDCKQDGFCNRYGREMRGRFRQICAGINCDLGTAAVFREQWLREAGEDNKMQKCKCWSVSSQNKPIAAFGCPDCKGTGFVNLPFPPTPLLLKTDQAPGDAVAMTAAIYSLHKAHPNKFLTAVESPYPEVFAYNPDVVSAESIPDALPIQMHYPAIHDSNKRAIHFMQGWCEFLGMALAVHVPLLTNRPHLYFDTPAPLVKDFWLVCSGGKQDLTNKLWGHFNYQEVVIKSGIPFIQVGNKVEDHPRLRGTDDMVGKTSLRQLFDLCRRARGVLCGVSLLMHVAAALEKPAIVIAGGREPVAWNVYSRQQYLHTVGMLQCSSPQGDVGGACWRSRTVPLGDNSLLDNHTCERPVGTTPECMTLISPARVTELILQYNKQYING